MSPLVLFLRCLLNVTVTVLFLRTWVLLHCNMKQQHMKISCGILDSSTLRFFSCLVLFLRILDDDTLLHGIWYLLHTQLKQQRRRNLKKMLNLSYFWLFFYNYLNCICNGEDCIITSLLMTAGGATPVGNGRGRSSYLSGVKIRDVVSFRVS